MFRLHRPFSATGNTSWDRYIICMAKEHSVLLLQYAQYSTKLNVLSSTISQHSNEPTIIFQFKLKEITASLYRMEYTNVEVDVVTT